MLKKSIYIGLAVLGGFKFLQSLDRYHARHHAVKKIEHKEALSTWEGEGGNPAGKLPRKQPA